MKAGAPTGDVLSSLIVCAIVAFSGTECLSADQAVKWRAWPFLEIARSSTNCGLQFREPIRIEFDGQVVKTTAWSGRTYDIELLEPLAADGSGQVYALSMPHHRSVVLKFEPGHGPRNIGYWRRYDTRCVWTFVPLEG